VAGLVFFPLLLATVARLVCPALRLQLIVAACAGLTALVFAAIKVWPLAGDAYRVGLGALQWPFRALGAALAGHGVPDLASVRLTADATDLYALPAVLARSGWRAVPPYWKRRPRQREAASAGRARPGSASLEFIWQCRDDENVDARTALAASWHPGGERSVTRMAAQAPPSRPAALAASVAWALALSGSRAMPVQRTRPRSQRAPASMP
jgi:hypothetical protein